MTSITTIETVRDTNVSLIELAGAVEIYTEDDNERAGKLLRSVLGVIKDIEEARLSITRGLDASKAAAIAQERTATAPFKEAEQHLRGLLLEWNQAQERELALERAALEAAASRAAEEGRQDDADAHMEALVEVPYKVARASGTSLSVHWSATVTDLASLVLAVASGDAPLNLLQANQSALTKLAQATKGPSTIKGVTFEKTTGIAASALR